MRSHAALSLLLLLGCASAPSDHRLSNWINEVLPPGTHQPTVLGSHYLRVHVQNLSHQTIEVQSVRVEAAGEDLDSDESSGAFNQAIGPGETGSFDLFLTVSTRAPHLPPAILTEVTLTVGGMTEQGKSFVDSGRYFIGRENSGS